MEDKAKETNIDFLLGAVQMSCMFIPALFLGQLLLLFSNSYIIVTIVLYGQPVLSALCFFIAAFSSNIISSFLKCVISLPFNLLLWVIAVKTDFFLRAVNWVSPDYGNLSAGNTFGFGISFLFTALAGAVAILISIMMSALPIKDKCSKPLTVWSKRVCLVLCCIVLISYILLALFMPKYVAPLG